MVSRFYPCAVLRLLTLSLALLTPLSKAQFDPAATSVSAKVRGEIIISRADGAWESQQVQESCILAHPRDPKKLVMFYSGVPKTNRVLCELGKAWADVSDPYTWHQDKANPIFSPSKDPTAWDSKTLRLDCVMYIPEEDAFYIYYSGSKTNTQDHIGLAICPAGDGYESIGHDTIKRFGNRPILAPEPDAPFSETMASQSTVWREPGDTPGTWKWYMYYSYRGKNGILPGIRLATSADGKSWTRHYNEGDPRGMGHIFDSTPNAYYEWHQISKIGKTYVLIIEVGINKGQRWRPVIAVSAHPDRGWQQLDVDTVIQTQWTGLYSDNTMFHVATPALYQFGEKWYLYVQACALPPNRNYIDGGWDIWCIAADRLIPTLPGLDPIHIPGIASK